MTWQLLCEFNYKVTKYICHHLKLMLGSSKVSCVRQSYSVLTFLLSRVFLKKVSFLLNWELSDQTKRSEVRFRIVIWQRVPIDSGKSSSHHRV